MDIFRLDGDYENDTYGSWHNELIFLIVEGLLYCVSNIAIVEGLPENDAELPVADFDPTKELYVIMDGSMTQYLIPRNDATRIAEVLFPNVSEHRCYQLSNGACSAPLQGASLMSSPLRIELRLPSPGSLGLHRDDLIRLEETALHRLYPRPLWTRAGPIWLMVNRAAYRLSRLWRR